MDRHKETLTGRLRAALCAGLLLASAAQALAVRVVVAGDSRNDRRGILPKIVKHANATPGLGAFIYLGDMTGGGSSAEFAGFKKITSQLSVPLYAVPGNHERGGGIRYEQLIGPGYYSKRVGAWRVIFIDNSRSSLGAAQWKWLKSTLEAAKLAREPVALAMHAPLWCPPAGGHIMGGSDRSRLLAAASKYRVKLVLAAHHHSYFKGVKNGITHITTGGAGAPLVGRGSFYHYVLLDLRDNGTFGSSVVRV